MRELEDELAALRAFRDELARRHAGDPGSLLRELAEQTRAMGRTTVRLPRRVPPVTLAAAVNPAAAAASPAARD